PTLGCGPAARARPDGEAQDPGAPPSRVRRQDGLAFPISLENDHEVGIETLDLPLLEDMPQRTVDETTRIHDHPIEPEREASLRHLLRRCNRRRHMALRRRRSDEGQPDHVSIAETRQRPRYPAEPDRGRRTDLGLAEIGVNHTDTQPEREKAV